MKAVIKRVLKGKRKGEHRFVLKADNGEIIAVSETYKNKKDMVEMLQKYFYRFEIIEDKK